LLINVNFNREGKKMTNPMHNQILTMAAAPDHVEYCRRCAGAIGITPKKAHQVFRTLDLDRVSHAEFIDLLRAARDIQKRHEAAA
jgi:hypothetical protein